MNPTLKALRDEIRAWTDFDLIERYVTGGDPTALAAVRPLSRRPPYLRSSLAKALPRPDALQEEERRILHVLFQLGCEDCVGEWLGSSVKKEEDGEDLLEPVRRELEPHFSVERFAGVVGGYVEPLKSWHSSIPSSAGRYLLGLSGFQLRAAFAAAGDDLPGVYSSNLPDLIRLLHRRAPARVPQVLQEILHPKSVEAVTHSWEELLKLGDGTYEVEVLLAYSQLREIERRFAAARALVSFAPEGYFAIGLEAARAALARPDAGPSVMEWMLNVYGETVLGDVVAYFSARREPRYALSRTLWALSREKTLPALLAALRNWRGERRSEPLENLFELGFSIPREEVHEALAELLEEEEDFKGLKKHVGYARQVGPAPHEGRLWELVAHRTRTVRRAAARALGSLGAGVVEEARKRLAHEDDEAVRTTLAEVLASAGTEEAQAALEAHLDVEDDLDVRDVVLHGLEAAWEGRGRQLTDQELHARIEWTRVHCTASVPDWLDEGSLPLPRLVDGGKLSRDALRYLLFRQKRVKEIRPDVEARWLYARIERRTGGDLALALLESFFASKTAPGDRWVLALAAALGDERLVPVLSARIGKWVEARRPKMAEYAARALALLASDGALCGLKTLAKRYGGKSVGQVARELLPPGIEVPEPVPAHRKRDSDLPMNVGEEVARAAERIGPYVRETPVEFSPILSQRGKCRVFLKLENYQVTSSVKVRGALNRLLAMDAEERAKGFYAASAGNHGAALAYARQLVGGRGVIVVPADASPARVEALRARGAEVVVRGGGPAEAERWARARAERRGVPFLSPYDDPLTIGGLGTVGLELERQLQRIGKVYVAVGGGGLISGIGGYFRARELLRGSYVRIVGCSPKNSPVMYDSLRKNKVRETLPTLSDGTAGRIEDGTITLKLCKRFIGDFILVEEEEIAEAMRLVAEHHDMMIEGAAAVAVAGFLKDRRRWGRESNHVVVLGGACVPLAVWRRLLAGKRT